MAMILDGKEVSSLVKDRIKAETESLRSGLGSAPTLAVVLVGHDAASETYVKSKGKACVAVGFGHRDIRLEEDTSEDELLDIIDALNEDDDVDGILVQLPLPRQISADKVIDRISVEKDVDGFSERNVGKILLGKDDGFVPCTPKGILALLDHYNIQTKGKRVCVIGRSNIVGKPIAALLMQKGRDATVTVCNSQTTGLSDITLSSDIIIVAVGKPGTLTGDMVKDGAVVIDVGINRIPDSAKKSGHRLVGDVDFESVEPKCSAITPVPGGVGPMTIAMLMENTLISFKRKKGR